MSDLEGKKLVFATMALFQEETLVDSRSHYYHAMVLLNLLMPHNGKS
jgi:hypothetical protein